MKPIWKACIAGAGVAAAGGAAIWGATELMITEALDREGVPALRRLFSRTAGAGGNSKMRREQEAAAERLRTAGTERVEITAPDGTKLVGHWRGCRGGRQPERVVVAMHGWRSVWYRDFGACADFLRDRDCAVLYAEQRAQGESDGSCMTFGMLERGDCLAWLRWVNENGAAGLPVYLMGISMGATTVLLAAGERLPENVLGVVADCGFTSAESEWKHVANHSFHLPYIRPLGERICRDKIHCSPADADTRDAMARTQAPVLFIHGTADRFVPPEMSQQNYEACTVEGKRLLLVPGAAHGMSYLVAPGQYQATVLSFWRELEGRSQRIASSTL